MPTFGNAIDFNRIPVKNFVVYKAATPRAGAVAGELWLDTSVTPNVLKWNNGVTWIAADSATSVADGSVTDIKVSATAAIQLSKLAVDPLARANHTGTQLAATVSDFDTQVRSSRLDQLVKPTADLDINSFRLKNLATPTAASDAANKLYVDNSRAGIAGVKDPVRVATLSNVSVASLPATIDGTTMVANDRVLLSGQTTGTESGIWVYTAAGTAATRPVDADGAGEIQDGTLVAVSEGTFAGYQFIQTASSTGAPGTWTQTWVQFQTGGQTYTAGSGLSLSGTQFAITAPVTVALGGTGGTTASAARTNLNTVQRYTQAMPALTAGVGATITHNLNSTDILVQVTQSGSRLELDWTATGANTVAFQTDISYTAFSLKVVILG